MQISGVSLALTGPTGFVYSEFFCVWCHCYKLSPFQAHWRRWHCTHFLRPGCLFTVHVGSGSSPLSCGVFLPPPLSQAFLLLIAGCAPCSGCSLSGQARLVHLQFQKGFCSPSFVAQGAPPSLQCVFILIAYYSVSLFFPMWALVCPGGYADLAQGCLWKYHVPLSSPCPCLPKPSVRGRLRNSDPSPSEPKAPWYNAAGAGTQASPAPQVSLGPAAVRWGQSGGPWFDCKFFQSGEPHNVKIRQ
jgi:hypothetical protein